MNRTGHTAQLALFAALATTIGCQTDGATSLWPFGKNADSSAAAPLVNQAPQAAAADDAKAQVAATLAAPNGAAPQGKIAALSGPPAESKDGLMLPPVVQGRLAKSEPQPASTANQIVAASFESPTKKHPLAPQTAPGVSDKAALSLPPLDRKWAHHTHGAPFIADYAAGCKMAKDSGKPTLLFFTTTSCFWCKRSAEDCFREPQIRALMDQYVCVLVDGETEQEACERYGVMAFPHTVVLKASGSIAGTQRGYMNAEQFRTMIEAGVK